MITSDSTTSKVVSGGMGLALMGCVYDINVSNPMVFGLCHNLVMLRSFVRSNAVLNFRQSDRVTVEGLYMVDVGGSSKASRELDLTALEVCLKDRAGVGLSHVVC